MSVPDFAPLAALNSRQILAAASKVFRDCIHRGFVVVKFEVHLRIEHISEWDEFIFQIFYATTNRPRHDVRCLEGARSVV